MAGGTWKRDEVGAAAGGRVSRALYALAIVTGPGFAALHLAGWIGALDATSWASAVVGLGLGWLAADLTTGTVHWACDTWGDASTPWIGPTLIRSFREHHRDPRAMLDHDWIDVNGEPAAAASFVFAVMTLPAARVALGEHVLVYAFLWSLLVSAALANQLHQWSHMPVPPPFVRHLQRWGPILSPTRHARHHRPPYTTAYCITSGRLNGLLDATGFWRALERAVSRGTGARPRADEQRAQAVRRAARRSRAEIRQDGERRRAPARTRGSTDD